MMDNLGVSIRTHHVRSYVCARENGMRLMNVMKVENSQRAREGEKKQALHASLRK